MSSTLHRHLHRYWSVTRCAVLTSSLLALAACGGGGGQDGADASASAAPATTTMRADARTAASPNNMFEIWVTGPGTVTSSIGTLRCTGTTSCITYYPVNSKIVLTATPTSGATISGWKGSCAGTSTSCSLTMNYPKSVSVSFAGSAAPPPPTAGAPMVLFTDIASGPTSGGESNNGVYLSIFGRNFGSTLADVSVTIGGHAVAKVISLGNSRVGAANPTAMPLQQIVVQVGSLGGAALGTSLPILVGIKNVAGTVSSSVQSAAAMFMPTPGRIIFASLTGNASGGTVNDVTKPFRYVQRSSMSDTTGAMAVSLPGDVIVMRAGTWQDLGVDSYFARFVRPDSSACGGGRGSGLAPSATGGPITLMGYPGEDVFIDMPPTVNGHTAPGALAALNGQNYPCAGQYINISNLRVEGGGADGAINLEVASTGWRVVNNEITAKTATSGALAGGIVGDGPNNSYYGNYIHDIYCGAPGSAPPWPGPKQNHGIYIDGGGVSPNYQGGTVQGVYDIAYNYVHNALGGYGLNVYNDANTVGTIANVHFHHNLIDGTGKGGINIADGSGSGIQIYNNIVVNSGYSGLRVNSNTLSGAKIYNNAFYIVNLNKDGADGMIQNDWNTPGGGWDIENNIFYGVAAPYSNYFTGDVTPSKSMGTVAHNLYFAGQGSTSLDSAPMNLDPMFMHNGTIASTGMVSGYDLHPQTASPAIHAGSSAVSSLVSLDFDDLAAGTLPSFDIGPYTFTP